MVLFSLKFVRSCTTQGFRKRIVESLVIPHLDYCSVVYLDASSTLRNRLQRLANACVRFIFGVRRDTHITPDRRKLEWLWTTPDGTIYFALLLTSRIVRIKNHRYFSVSLRPISQIDRILGLLNRAALMATRSWQIYCFNVSYCKKTFTKNTQNRMWASEHTLFYVGNFEKNYSIFRSIT